MEGREHTMNIQYKQTVIWDTSLIDVGTIGSEQSVVPSALRGLAVNAIKITTGAPNANAAYFLPGAQIINVIDGLIYINVGSTASPVWEVTQSSPSAELFRTVLAGTATGGTTATRAYTVTGAVAATDFATAVIRASTNAASIQKATLTDNTLTVLFSTDPGAGTTVDYTIVRPA